eukprot:8795749-Alexandrium_andersonii.AAC.1
MRAGGDGGGRRAQDTRGESPRDAVRLAPQICDAKQRSCVTPSGQNRRGSICGASRRRCVTCDSGG